MSLSFVENEDGQQRYEESLYKMNLIGDALLKMTDYKNQQLMSGFVFDNGVLPPVDGNYPLEPLVRMDEAWAEESSDPHKRWMSYGAVSPYYDTYTLSGGAYEITGSEYQLFKGYRGGYIREGLDSQQRFKDAWGDNYEAVDAAGSYTYTLKSGATKSPDILTGDKSRVLQDADWGVSVLELEISIVNNTGDGLGTQKKGAIIIFKNTKSDDALLPEDKWLTLYFSIPDLAAGGSLITNPSTAWWKKGVIEQDARLERLPAGRHLIVVFDESNRSVEDHVFVDVFPRTSLPTVSLEID